MEIISQSDLLRTAYVKSADENIENKDMFSSFWKELFAHAHMAKASDIHVHQGEGAIDVFFRILGEKVLYKSIPSSRALRDQYINKFKFIAGFNLASNDEAQDRAFTLRSTNSRYRAVITPAHFGEYIVMRIIRESDLPRISELDLPSIFRKDLLVSLSKPQGLICVTGPTGSGKSTTLQACLMELDRIKKNIITIEDPIERIIPSITQQQVTNRFNWTTAIKSAMRQDPDIILIGEIRDKESACLALEASQTGHLVLTTLHSNDVFGIFDRLIGLGVEKNLIRDNLIFASSQRLVQRICDHCKLPIESNGIRFYTRGGGCNYCSPNQGIIGRKLVTEHCTSLTNESLFSDFCRKKFRSTELKTSLYSSFIELSKEGIVDYLKKDEWSSFHE